MKWVTTDYRGSKRVWYSGDVIMTIEAYCRAANCLGTTLLAKKILDLIEGENNERNFKD